MTSQDFKKLSLPEAPGVYFFKDSAGNILYIGRATSLYDRVHSYFSNDLIATRGPLLVDMVTKASTVEYVQTDSVLEAVILESNEIKKYLPHFNTKEKDNKSYNFLIITDEEFPRIVIVRGRTLELLNENELGFKIKYQFGPYPQGSLLRDALKIVRKIFPFRDEKATLKHHESFYRSIGLSPDTDSPEAKKDYQRTIRNLVLFFEGKKGQLIKVLEKEMDEYADALEFEKAQKIRNTLYALNHIQDVSLIKAENDASEVIEGFRIEAYDIAHMSGKDTVGVMTVVINGELQKSHYKKFKISKDANNDTAALKEILTRRFNHPEWKSPDLIAIDGGIGQLNAAKEIVKSIPVVSIVKNDAHKPDHFLGDEKMIEAHGKDILLANSESHRFAIAYHKKLRSRAFLKRVAK
ncbi:MAG: excinuclease subunit [Patescibacteria group bacterium]|nr:excinuclease subunit [Patescibacteria group bacterium]